MRRHERIPIHDHSDFNSGGFVAASTIVRQSGGVVATAAPSTSAGTANIYDADWFDVTAYGAVHDGTTDDTAAIQAAIDAAETAGGGVVYFPAGVYAVSGALADTSRSNAQLLLPIRDVLDDEQITIVLLGAYPPSPQVSVIGSTTVPDNQSVIKGTLSSVSGTSPSLLGGMGPSGSAEDFTFVHAEIRNLTFRLPSNPVYSALNLSHVGSVRLDNVVVDVGSYYVQGLTEPTTSASYGIRLPKLNNSAYTRLGAVNVIGFYTGIQAGEHTVGEQVALWGCKVGVEFIAGYHASHFDRLMTVHCERGIKFTGGAHYFTIDQFNIEHAASGWWVTDYDIDDASNYGYGHGAWKVTLAGVGHDSTFTINGGSNQHWIELGDDPYDSAVASAHIADTSDAHDASAISIADAGGYYTGTDVEAALQELGADVAALGATGHYEQIVSGSAPPVAVTNEAEDDWLVGWVPD